MCLIFQNYHKHDSYTNVRISDSVTKLEEYAKRAVELGHGILASTQHGWQGSQWETIKLARKYNLKPVIGAEAYWVKDRLEQDRTNCHIVILAKNENGRKALNDVLSEANISGFYGQPRLDIPLILSLPANDVIVTTACIAYHRYEDIDDITLQFYNHFKDNFYLEVQAHYVDSQIKLNQHLLDLHNQYGIKLIAGCDSHYIIPEDAQARTDFLISKGMNYPDEENWYLDYPDGDTLYKRFAEQCVLNHEEILEAIDNTNVLLEVEEYDDKIFNTDIKMPTLYPELNQEDKDKIYKDLVYQGWDKYKQTVPQEQWAHYEEEIAKEVQTVIDTKMSDYFIINYHVIKQGKENGGNLTKSGRGCFTKEAIISTTKGFKHINEVEIGDKVFDINGKPQRVLNTLKYHIDEPLVKINYAYMSDKFSPMICTLDHKILVRDKNANIIWKQAKDITNEDYLCSPKLELQNNQNSTIDLNNYNVFGYKYDDEYIYENNPYRNKTFKFNPSEVSRAIGCGKSIIENIANKKRKVNSKNQQIVKNLLSYTGFKTLEDYADYVQAQRTIKIHRFIPNDFFMNFWVGCMYGDGFASLNKTAIGLALNPKTHKDTVNKTIFKLIAQRVGIKTTENLSKNKNLCQIYMSSNILSNYIHTELFISRKGMPKTFNEKLLQQSKTNLCGILQGLSMTDGSYCESTRTSFDNTSLSLAWAYKALVGLTSNNPVSINARGSWNTKDGYICKTSYKLRSYNRSGTSQKRKERTLEDEKYTFLPVWGIEKLQAMETDVYDITVENSHSYMLNNIVVHNSAVSFFTNMLLGFTEVDRISAKVHMYPERFISTTRILQSATLPDVDFNLGNVEPFARAQQQVLGEDHAYPMIAYGTMQKSAAWKLYAKSQGVPFEIANAVSEQIKKYETALKHAEEDEKDSIEVLDYIDKEYHSIYEKSKDYLGLITSWSIAPCSYLLFDGSIRENFGLVKVKDHLCCTMDGHWAEECHYLKNDLLKVSVVDLIYKAYRRIGREPPSVKELLDMCPPDDKCWDIYAKSCTIGINQCEQAGTAQRVAKYSPKNISELGAFVAAIRPGFKSMYKTFESRQPFAYGVKAFDDLIQTDEMPNSFLLYQEQEMAALNYAGIDMSDCYTAIKNIAKKRVEKVLTYKDKFVAGFSNVMVDNEGKTLEEASKITNNLWQIINDSASYLFNASHSYCVALDSLYGAWLKAHHPLEFYEVYLQIQEQKGDKDKMNAAKAEAEDYFGIHFPALKFGQDNRNITAAAKTNSITNSLSSIKGFGSDIGCAIYECSQQNFSSFLDVLQWLNERSIKSSKVLPLIQIDYFDCYGTSKQLTKLLEAWDLMNQGTRKMLKKDKDLDSEFKNILLEHTSGDDKLASYKINNAMEILKEYEQYILQQDEDYDIKTKMKFTQEILGYVNVITNKECDRRRLLITDCSPVNSCNSNNIWAFRVGTRSLGSGKTARLTIKVDKYKQLPVQEGDVVYAKNLYKNKQGYWYLMDYEVEK